MFFYYFSRMGTPVFVLNVITIYFNNPIILCLLPSSISRTTHAQICFVYQKCNIPPFTIFFYTFLYNFHTIIL